MEVSVGHITFPVLKLSIHWTMLTSMVCVIAVIELMRACSIGYKILFLRKMICSKRCLKTFAAPVKAILSDMEVSLWAIRPPAGLWQAYLLNCIWICNHYVLSQGSMYILYKVTLNRSTGWIMKPVGSLQHSYSSKSAWHSMQPVCTSCLWTQMFW